MDGSITRREWPGTTRSGGTGGSGTFEQRPLVESLQDWSGRLELELGLFRLQLDLLQQQILGQEEFPR